MRTTVDINEMLLKKLKQEAKNNKLTLSGFIEKILSENIFTVKKKKKFKLITIKGEVLDKSLNFDRVSEILEKEGY